MSNFSLRDQTVHFVNCKRIPQQAKTRYVVESATLLFFFAPVCWFGFYGQIAKTLNCSKLLQKQVTLRNPQIILWNPEQVCGIHEQIIIHVFSKIKLSRKPQLSVESANCKRNPQIVCGIRINLRIHLHLRNPLTFAESGTTTYIFALQNPQQNQCADKIYVTGICTRNPLQFCKWNPLTFWNIFYDMSLESRNIQTQNCAPIQCIVWFRIIFYETFTVSKLAAK